MNLFFSNRLAAIGASCRKQNATTLSVDLVSKLFLLGSFLYAFWNLSIIWESYYRIPYWDYWAWLQRYYCESFLTAATALYNEHRQFFPSFIFALDQIIGAGRNVILLVFLLLVQLSTFFLLLLPLAKESMLSHSVKTAFFAFALVCALWFQQGENLFWPISFHTLFCNFCWVLALYFWTKKESSDSKGYYRFLLVSCPAVLASFSFGHGILLWPVLVLFSLLRRQFVTAVCFGVEAVIVVAIYLHNYITPGGHASPLASLSHPLSLIKYICVYLGRPFISSDVLIEQVTVYHELIAGVFGAIGLAVVAGSFFYFVAFKQSDRIWEFYLGIALLAIGAATITALGRINFTIGQSLASRYVTIQLLFWVSVLVLAVKIWVAKSGNNSLVDSTVLLGLIILSLFSSVLQRPTAAYYRNKRSILEQQARGAILGVYDNVPWTKYVFPGIDLSKGVIAVFKAQKLSMYSMFDVSLLGREKKSFTVCESCCHGEVGVTKEIEIKNKHALKSAGYISKPQLRGSEGVILVVDSQSDRVVGWGNTGTEIPKIKWHQKFQNNENPIGWVSYTGLRKIIDAQSIEYFLLLDNQTTICPLGLENVR